MTKQEFVKKESDKFEPPFMEHPIDMFQSGLTKGLEIAEGFRDWCKNESWKHDYAAQKSHTTPELIEIYLNEIR